MRSARPLARSLVLPAVLGSLAASCSSPTPAPWQEADGYRWRELRVRGGEAGFTALPHSRTGVDFANRLDLERALDNEHLLIGSGVALGDVDGDGRTDIYLNRLQGPNALYRNLGDWRFEEVAVAAGVALGDRYSTGAALADLDGDGDLDLVVTSLGGPDAVFRNDGTGRFTEVGDAGLAPGLGSTTVALADVDADGDLDLYVTAYKAESASDVLRLLERSPAEMIAGEADSLSVPAELREHYRIEEQGGRRRIVEQAEPDRLYLNDGTGRFEPVSWTGGGFRDADGTPLEREIDDFGLAARFHDVDGDGDPDLYVCNDFDDPDQLWLNLGDGTFQAAPRLALRTTSHASMSVDFADVDRDGRVDLFVAEMRSRDPRRRLLEIPFHGVLRKPIGAIDDRPQVQRNTLFWNRGDGSFAEIAVLAGVDASDWTWGSVFLDVDLDGYEDLLVANGYSRDTQHGDVADRISALSGQTETRELKRLYPELRSRNVAFRNQGDLTFREVGGEWGFGTEADISHGIAAGDLDGDGDLDLVLNRLGEPAALLRNDGQGKRVAVRLRGRAPNTYGVGTRVRLWRSATPFQEAEVSAGGLYLSSSEPLLVFAAGRADSMRLEVEWPGGARSVVAGVRPDRLYEVWEEGALPAPIAAGRGTSSGPRDPGSGRSSPGSGLPAPGAAPAGSVPLFADASPLLNHRHSEDRFEDFLRQPLLPYRPSRLGPGVSWLDVDGDGDPDLLVPPGASGRLGYLRNDDGRFRPVWLEEDASPLDRSAAVIVSGEGGQAVLLVGQSSYEATTVEEARGVPALLRVDPSEFSRSRSAPRSSDGSARRRSDRRAGPEPLLTGELSSAGPLALSDVDGDGDLDLFLGGRVIKVFYPLPPTSWLLRNEGGVFVKDPENEETLRELGLVSGAVFSDVDGDGDSDLLLAMEWGPIRLLVNEGGRLADATADWGLDRLEGRWNGIATGDFDGDGRQDVAVTGWGWNVWPRPEPDRPLVLYHGDWDRNGTWDLLPAMAERAGGELRPLEAYHRLRAAVPSIRDRLPTFEAYAEASLEEVLGAPLREVLGVMAREYGHLLLWNRGGRFEAQALPMQAQFAPATGVAVADFDGDGNEDLFLSQNFFPTRLDRPRYDAGLGILLRGDGAGGFQPLPATQSGVRVYGDARGAAVADFDADGRTDLAVAQNGGATRLFRNVAARPGLRVRLRGPPGNLQGIGAVLRVVYVDGEGPAREIHAGSGYWSVDEAVPVLGLRSDPVEVRIRWPGGGESRVPVSSGAREITAVWPGGQEP
ncbi:MAG: FG-GAP repeat domain-containing protein [Gemmatimonadota bacterium]